MRAAMAIFGTFLVLTAVAIGWMSPVELAPVHVGAVSPEPEAAPAAKLPEAAADPVAAPETAPVAEETAAIGDPEGKPEEELDENALYTSANVRLRSGPSSNFSIVWTAPAGTQVRSMQVDGNWHFVVAEGYEGWMYNRYLTDQRPR